MRKKKMYTCMCNWITMLYSRKLTEHCKPAIMEKNKNHYINKITFFFVFLPFLGPHPQHMEVPRQGSNRSRSHQLTPEPQQHRIRATSETYTTAHGNARSLTH